MTSEAAFQSLPIRKSTGDLLPCVIVDTREQEPLDFRRLPSRPGTLATGDYSIAGLENDVAIERKSIADLVGSLTSGRARFQRELERMRSYNFARLLIVGTEADIAARRYRSNASPVSIMHSLYAIESRGVPVVFSATPYEAALLLERWVWWRARAVMQASNELIKGCTQTAQHVAPIRTTCEHANNAEAAISREKTTL